MNKQTIRLMSSLVASLVVGVSAVSGFASLSTSTKPISQSVNATTPFQKTEVSTFANLTAQEVLNKQGETLDGEKTLANVHKNQSDFAFTIDYDKTSYSFIGDSKTLYSIETTDPSFIGPRDTKIGMPVKDLLSKFQSNTNTASLIKSNDSDAVLKAFKAKQYTELYTRRDNTNFYNGAIDTSLDEQASSNDYRIVYEHGDNIIAGNLNKMKETIVSFEIKDEMVSKISILFTQGS